jgi:glutaredoxin-like YruB-family protein
MAKNVRIYANPACPYCIRAKQFLKDKAVIFEEIDITADKTAVEEMLKLSGQMGVPVLDIDGEIIVGFDKDAISNALGIA